MMNEYLILENVSDEAIDLSVKYKLLNKFIESEKFSELPVGHRIMLNKQRDAMAEYLNVLDVRLELLRVGVR